MERTVYISSWGTKPQAGQVVEAGVKYAIGYPWTPSTEVIETLIQGSKKNDVRTE